MDWYLGPQKIIRPVQNLYIRLVTEFDPSIIPESQQPINIKDEDIEMGEDFPQNFGDVGESWMKTQRWYVHYQVGAHQEGKSDFKMLQTLLQNDPQQREPYWQLEYIKAIH